MMNMNIPTPEVGKTVRIGLVIYEKVFSIISEVNYRCGPINGTGLTVSEAFSVLLTHCLAGLIGLDEINFRVQRDESENLNVFKMNVELDTDTSRQLDEITASLNEVMQLSWDITGEVVLELLVRRCSRELRKYLFTKYRRSDFHPIKL